MKRTLLALGTLVLAGTIPRSVLLAQGAIVGIVVDAERRPVAATAVRAVRDGEVVRDGLTDGQGAFRLAGLPAGLYTVTVRRVGHREAELPFVRVADGQTVSLSVVLTQAARQLSTIQVVSSPTAVDVSRPDLTMSIDRSFSALLPSTREASGLIAVVPGARKDQLWGGAPGVSNDYQLDGISMSHPGIGGDVLALSVDWIERVEVGGLGLGAEHGDFQGGVVNAITRTGTSQRQGALRMSVESERLTASNLVRDDVGLEPAGRREAGGELLGPIARDRLFYFVAGQLVEHRLRAPDPATPARDFQRVRERHRDGRGLAKLTWLPASGQRLDVLGGLSVLGIEHAGIDGVDDATALSRIDRPTVFYEVAWTSAATSRGSIAVKLAGFRASETRRGYAGPGVPGVQVMQAGLMPAFQNAPFDERREPSRAGATVEWTRVLRAAGAQHRLVLGGEASRGAWRDERTRNGGMTWRPYTAVLATVDPLDATTWRTVGSDWGGDVRLHSDVTSEALFAQDYIAIGSRLTVTPGLRFGRWSGFLRPACGSVSPCYRFEAVRDDAADPRIGLAWDVTGRGDLALKAHWGRYHQGMHALFFDRAHGANVYTNERFYHTGPRVISGLQTFTVAERDDPRTGFSTTWREFIRDETGRVEHYRQPYVDQLVVGIEKAFGASWKGTLLFTDRVNRDIVGLVDRNLRSNYTRVHDTRVEHRFVNGRVRDAHGNPLVLPLLYVANTDIRDLLVDCIPGPTEPCRVFGFTRADLDRIPWNPDVALTTVPDARRHYRQLTGSLRARHDWWQGEGSLTVARLRGNVAGVTGYGAAGTRFSAGPFVRPNEAINASGPLPDALELQGKVWLTARLPGSLEAGVLFTHTRGERFAPSFEINERYLYLDSTGALIPYRAFTSVLGQSVFVEPRGSRQYGSREEMDLHVEWRRGRHVLSADAFNILFSNAITLINTNIGDESPSDPNSYFAAIRRRVAPPTVRLGIRTELGR